MTDPEFSDRGASLDPAERDIEAPDADALEQQIPADPQEAAEVQPPQRSDSLGRGGLAKLLLRGIAWQQGGNRKHEHGHGCQRHHGRAQARREKSENE